MFNYFPFGMRMWNRSFNSSEYKFGFNGKEKDDELKGEGNSYDFGARIYDPRIGRWLNTDPFESTYPSLSPYNFAANNPIYYVDPDGSKIKPGQNSDYDVINNYFQDVLKTKDGDSFDLGLALNIKPVTFTQLDINGNEVYIKIYA